MKFLDSEDREWTPRVTVRVLRELERISGVNVFAAVFDFIMATQLGRKKDPVTAARIESKEMMVLFQKIFGNVTAFSGALYLACKEQAVERDVSEEEFYESLGPQELLRFKDTFGDWADEEKDKWTGEKSETDPQDSEE